MKKSHQMLNKWYQCKMIGVNKKFKMQNLEAKKEFNKIQKLGEEAKKFLPIYERQLKKYKLKWKRDSRKYKLDQKAKLLKFMNGVFKKYGLNGGKKD